jgi:hypothetical protein
MSCWVCEEAQRLISLLAHISMSSAPSGGSPTGGSCAFSGSAGTALTIVVALLAAFVVLFFINGYVTCFPKIFVQWINDRAFLNE